MRKRHTLESVKQYFKEHGCELLEEEYKNNSTKMEYKCSCGNISEITLGNFQAGKRCQKCGGKEKHTLEYVKQYFKDKKCELLETEYINSKTKMKYMCSCGNNSEIIFSNFLKGCKCQKCAKNEKYTLEYVKKYFTKQKCKLLENKYINSFTAMKYRCICEDISKITFANFKTGRRCKKCGCKKITGKNSPHYNPNMTNEDRMNGRRFDGYKEWAKKIYQKNKYTCQKCHIKKDNSGKYKKLNAHHIEGFAENKELRLDLNNGITFCQNCHNKLHAIYGKKNITKKHLDMFLKMSNNYIST
jgi:hypothetical protein